jgi:hypothetical protein
VPECDLCSSWIDRDVHSFGKADQRRAQKAAEMFNGTMVSIVFDAHGGVYRIFGPGGQFELPVTLNKHLTMIIEGSKDA